MEPNDSRMEHQSPKEQSLIQLLDQKYIMYIYDNLDPLWLEGYHRAIEDLSCVLKTPT
jgi:hypothetical protein